MYKKTKYALPKTCGLCIRLLGCVRFIQPRAAYMDELQPTPDLRKSTLCINFTRGRCATKDCRFAHGTHELRNANTIPDNNEYTCPMWEMGRCSLGIHCKLEHCFAERVGEQKENLKTNSLDKTNEPARKVLSIDDSLPRRRLDLFPHLDFSNESELDDASALRLLPNDLHGSIGVVSILSTEGDDSPWNLPN